MLDTSKFSRTDEVLAHGDSVFYRVNWREMRKQGRTIIGRDQEQGGDTTKIERLNVIGVDLNDTIANFLDEVLLLAE